MAQRRTEGGGLPGYVGGQEDLLIDITLDIAGAGR
ncbi:hypothetical protein GGQ54_001896 [Naumannella cuiyingiana]|uniref:Uncharacterized protein n=1 Tax=Naumannella cuiyingiana TaxID=1347891 RepID=A0A7Z0D9A0_9ACTN|nr:hypothetical protein [Naumannella cuiyingiana]